MKRSRAISHRTRTISEATRSGLITADERHFLQQRVSQGDPVVEEALEEASNGNAGPLTALLASGKNPQLRARLATLSRDGHLRERLSVTGGGGGAEEESLRMLYSTLEGWWAGQSRPRRRAAEPPSRADQPRDRSP